jgi:adenine C2-methylase RlmN of 23S rRNA A2503 and tRNA A37
VELWEILHLIQPAHDMVQWSYGKYCTSFSRLTIWFSGVVGNMGFSAAISRLAEVERTNVSNTGSRVVKCLVTRTHFAGIAQHLPKPRY